LSLSVSTQQTVSNWFVEFRIGNLDFTNDPRGRPESKVNNDLKLGKKSWKKFNNSVLHELNEKQKQKRFEIAHCTNDRAPKLQDLELELLYHSRYEPDLAPTDYHFFRNLDNFLIVKNFSSDNALKLASHEFIDSRPSGFYTTGLNNLPLKWQRTI
uniref:Uncharacterized protein n=1 Tax=Glossina palpalis gambiensis TaxID=67801 RepID=A0A1B0C5A3_9MUSC